MSIDFKHENQLLWTGERYIPERTGQIQPEHVHRYLLAREYAKDKDVLDIACGEGFGSAILAKTARSVTGVDIASEAVEHAAARYRLENVHKEYLPERLHSIAAQTYQNIEIILLDDASTDNSQAILQKFSTEDSRARFISNTQFVATFELSRTERAYVVAK
jgi:2-polyprenyl-3-methyl-5-hydroxy-6-metoxy-1,4-benzoquinol methylase